MQLAEPANADFQKQDAACSAYPPGSERVTLEKGMLAVGGSGPVKGQLELQTNLTIRSLAILNDTWLQVINGVELTVIGSLVNNGSINISENGDLIVTGKVSGSGTFHKEGSIKGIYLYAIRKTDWFYPYVSRLTESGINAYNDYSFRPYSQVTWEEALKLIMLAGGKNRSRKPETIEQAVIWTELYPLGYWMRR